MGFQQGLSGLNSSSTSLDVTGNNVANASTVGFKQARAEFADMYANSLNGAGASQIGLGAKVAAITQQFTQGGITVTNNPLDIAINGGGFFRMSNNGANSFTRNGQFQLDKNGYIVNAAGYKLQGYLANSTGTIQSTALPVDLRLFDPTQSTDVPPQVTGGSTAGTGVVGTFNLDSREATPTVTPFNYGNPSSYNHATAISVYDSLGNAHTYSLYFVKSTTPGGAGSSAAIGGGASAAQGAMVQSVVDAVIAAGGTKVQANSALNAALTSTNAANAAVAITALGLPAGVQAAALGAVAGLATTSFNGTAAQSGLAQAAVTASTTVAGQWDVYATIANPASASTAFSDLSGGGVTKLASLFYNTSGTLSSTIPAAVSQTITAAQLGASGVNVSPLTFKVDLSGSTEYGAAYNVSSLTQDGYTSGSLAGFNVGADGIIVGRYTNGVTKNLVQVTLDNFRDPQGLESVGNNQWVETSASGSPLTGTPGVDGNHGPLQSAAVEDSNVDLTQELVNMIIAQRVYQANAQTIKTQDSVLQTLVNLR